MTMLSATALHEKARGRRPAGAPLPRCFHACVTIASPTRQPSHKAKAGGTPPNGALGAPGSEDFPDAGAAYVFRRVGERWRQDQRLAASDGFAPDHFDQSVGLSGDRLVVGQLGTVLFQPLGAVYEFAQHGIRWKEVARLTLNSNEPDFFGYVVDGLSGKMDQALQILMDVLQQPAFLDDDIDYRFPLLGRDGC